MTLYLNIEKQHINKERCFSILSSLRVCVNPPSTMREKNTIGNFLVLEDYNEEDLRVLRVTRRPKVSCVVRFGDEINKGVIRFHSFICFNLVHI
jgi:hypothetical protein